ncbi:MAG: DVU0298 family protein [Desulfomonilaceae bacterium]
MVEALTGRDLKKKVLELLRDPNFSSSLEKLRQLSCRTVINPLLSLLLDHDELVKWRAVTAIGAIVSLMVEKDTEAARVIMRRLMWSLNDESGGIGWGAPEAMSEIMAQSNTIAEEYSSILISYLDEQGNFLEYEPLQKGLIWGVARLATVRPDLMKPASMHLHKYLSSNDASIRGLSALSIGLLKATQESGFLRELLHDHAEFQTFSNDELRKSKVSDFAVKALSLLN